MYKDIEFVCSGNQGRSPLAEAFAKKYLDKKKLLEEVSVSSSGTLVDFLKTVDEEQLAQLIEPLIPKALRINLITDNEAEDIRERRNLKNIETQILQRVNENEIAQKRIISEDFFLPGYFDLTREPQQTIVRAEARLILPVDTENCKRVARIYDKSGISPGIKPLGEIEDPILATLEEYKTIACQIEKAVKNEITALYG